MSEDTVLEERLRSVSRRAHFVHLPLHYQALRTYQKKAVLICYLCNGAIKHFLKVHIK